MTTEDDLEQKNEQIIKLVEDNKTMVMFSIWFQGSDGADKHSHRNHRDFIS